MKIGGAAVPTHLIELAAQSDTEMHVWFAVYRDSTALTDAEELQEMEKLKAASKSVKPVIGIGTITVTITTSSAGSATLPGDVNEEVP